MTAFAEMPAVLTVEEAAKYLRVGRSAAYAAIKSGDIPHIKVGRSIRVPRHRLEHLLGLQNESTPADEPGLTKAAGGNSHEQRYTQ